MILSVRVDAETTAAIERLARQRRSTKSQVIREAVAALAERERNGARGPSPYDAIPHLIGCYDSGGLRLSEHTGEKFAVRLREQRRARRAR